MSAIQQVLLGLGGGAAGGDPYFSSVVSLLHMDGTNGSTTFTDQKGLTWAATGNAALDTSVLKYGTASMYSSTGGIQTSTNVSAIGTGDFTCECWFNWASVTTAVLIDLRSASQINNPAIYVNSGNLYYYASSANAIGGGLVTTGSWVHIAVSRVSNTSRLFVNGVQGTTYSDTASYGAAPITLNKRYDGTALVNGHMDDFRLTVGVGRYTSNFTPPTSAFPDS